MFGKGVPGGSYFLLHSINDVKLLRVTVASGIMAVVNTVSTDPLGTLLKQCYVFDAHPTITQNYLVPNRPLSVISWDYTTMTGTSITSTKTFEMLVCASATVCVAVSTETTPYLYSFDPSLLPTLTLTQRLGRGLALATNKNLFAARQMGYVYILETAKITVVDITNMAAEFKSVPVNTTSTPFSASFYSNSTSAFFPTGQLKAGWLYSTDTTGSHKWTSRIYDPDGVFNIYSTLTGDGIYVSSPIYMDNLVIYGLLKTASLYMYEQGPCNIGCTKSWCYSLSSDSCYRCDSQFIIGAVNGACCASTCTACRIANPYDCTSCIAGTYLSSLDNTCGACTSPGTISGANCVYPPPTCDPSCATCTGSGANQCSTCSAGLYLQSGNTCVSCTQAGFYISGTSCLPCNGNCATCVTSATNCQSCNPTTNYIMLNSGNICGTTCPAGNYVTTYNGQNACALCTSPCATCTAAGTSACSSCISGYTLSGSTCSNGCDPTCLTCSGATAADCTSCSSGMYLSGASPSSCLTCVAPCATCSSASTCLTCTTDYLMPDNTCNACTAAGTYQYVQSGVNKCGYCTAPCSSCAGTATSCTACTAGLFVLPNSQCSSCNTAGVYQYSNSGIDSCGTCDASCATCSGTSTSCLSCASGYETTNPFPTACTPIGGVAPPPPPIIPTPPPDTNPSSSTLQLTVVKRDSCGDGYQSFCYIIQPSSQVSNSVLTQLVNMNIIHCSITTPSQTLREPGNLFVSYTAYQGQIYLTISLKAASPSQQFSVNIEMNRDSSSIAMPDSSSVVFSAFSQSFPVALSIDQRDLDFGAQMGNTIGGLVNLNPTREKSY